MEQILLEIIGRLRQGQSMGQHALEKVIRAHNRNLAPGQKPFSKKRLLPYYLKVREQYPKRWNSWGVDERVERELVALLQVKPHRTASGVATVTVITKPHACSSHCIYCPNDLRMPKSYLADEPACQRAEHNCFDPYLQVSSRIRALTAMGHPTDKVELIVLGGTWDDYPREYRIWFIEQLFEAMNDGHDSDAKSKERRREYREAGISNDPGQLEARARQVQHRVDRGQLGFNQGIAELYGQDPAWQRAGTMQSATLDQLREQHRINETAGHRVVGLVVETRPDAITPQSLTLLRQLGCTKVQMGVQSTRDEVLAANDRGIDAQRIGQAMALTRAFGFKIHAHFMVNLLGSTAQDDILDYREFVTSSMFCPDEVKLYPCSLVPGTKLVESYKTGRWVPYSEEQLVDVLVSDIMQTPPYVRVSRMIRDIPAGDIQAGNKKTNLRQMVENGIREQGLAPQVREIRFREISTGSVELDDLRIDSYPYETTSSGEIFLQWVDGEGRIAGFLRLSMPRAEYVCEHADELPVGPGEAMIREVHVYGRAARLHRTSGGAQHMGLGRILVEEACRIATERGFSKINVISSVGTREYYRGLGFRDNGLYQQRDLKTSANA